MSSRDRAAWFPTSLYLEAELPLWILWHIGNITIFCFGMSSTFHFLLLTNYFHKTCRDLLFLILYLSDKYGPDCCPLVNNRETNSACSYKSCFFCCFYLAPSNSCCFQFICGIGKEKGLREGNHLLLYRLLSRMPVEAESKRDAYCYIMNML